MNQELIINRRSFAIVHGLQNERRRLRRIGDKVAADSADTEISRLISLWAAELVQARRRLYFFRSKQGC